MNKDLSNDNKKESTLVFFDNFTFNFFPAWLKHNDTPVKISPMSATILQYLIENQHKTITSEQIKSHCWSSYPKTHSFNTAISLLRNTLGDSKKADARNSWRLITNPQTGVYSLGVKVIYPSDPVDYIRLFKRLSLASILICGAAVAAIEIIKPATYLRSNSQPISTLKGDILFNIAVSPEKTLIFSHRSPWSKKRQLMVKRWNEQAKPLMVSSFDSANKPLALNNVEASFSPSGAHISWIRTDFSSYCDVMIADFDSRTTTLSNLKSIKGCNNNYFARTPQWRTETALLVSLPQGQNRPNNIYELDLLTNESYQLTFTPNGGVGDYGLFYNAEADKMVYLRSTAGVSSPATEVNVYDFNSRESRHLKNYSNYLYSVAWKDRNNLLLKGNNGFELLNLNGKVTPLSDKVEHFEYYPFALGNDEFGYVKGGLFAGDIQVVDLVTGIVDMNISSTGLDYRPVFARASDVIVYASQKNGVMQLFSSAQEQPITQFIEDSLIIDLNVSYDANTIAYVKDNRLNLITDQGVLLHSIDGDFGGITFTPDGNSLVYSKVNNTGQNEIIKLSLSDFSEQKLTLGHSPKVTENGDIYYIESIKNKAYLHKITSKLGVSQLMEVTIKGGNSTSIDVINNTLYYVKDIKGELFLMANDLKNGKTTKITAMDGTRFSLNGSASKLVTTKKVPTQNNIEFFSISRM